MDQEGAVLGLKGFGFPADLSRVSKMVSIPPRWTSYSVIAAGTPAQVPAVFFEHPDPEGDGDFGFGAVCIVFVAEPERFDDCVFVPLPAGRAVLFQSFHEHGLEHAGHTFLGEKEAVVFAFGIYPTYSVKASRTDDSI